MSTQDSVVETDIELSGRPSSTTGLTKEPRKQPRRPPVVLAMLRSFSGAFAIGYLLIVILACFAAPLLTPYDPVANNLSDILALPSPTHPLGTDELGRDVLSRLLYGGQASFTGVAYAIVTAVLIGVPLGILSGFHGKHLDAVMSRIVDIMLAIPSIIILLMIFAVYGSNQFAAMFTLGVLFAPSVIRISRAATLSTREELFVAAAKVAGLNPRQIMVRHVLPRISGPIIVNAAIMTGNALLVQAGLSFLGLGIELPKPSWGGMVAEAGAVLRQQPWLVIPSGAAISFTVLAFVLLGDSIRDASQGVRTSTVPNLASSKRIAQHLAPTDADASPEAGSDSVLRITELSVELPLRAGWTTVVDKVSFSVRAGETLGLVGESGCGKTVTALAVLGLIAGGGRVSHGSVNFDGTNLVELTNAQMQRIRGKRIGYISQEPMVSLDPSYTVGNQLMEAVRQHERLPRPAAKARVIELLQQTGIPDPAGMAKKYPHQISGGMAQRVVIARALAGRPSLLIADEPTTALDSTVQQEILALLRRLQVETGMAVILVTHDWGVVAETCDRAVVMYAGQIVEASGVVEVFDNPLHPYTDGLMRANPHLVAEGEHIKTIEGTVPQPAQWPIGCRFAARCRFATTECRERPIPLTEPSEKHLSRCIHIEELKEANA